MTGLFGFCSFTRINLLIFYRLLCFCCVYGFIIMSPLFKAILKLSSSKYSHELACEIIYALAEVHNKSYTVLILKI